jgi:hypothetical protein
MPKFEIQHGEYLIREGLVSYFKSSLNVKSCDGTLTTRRFVVCAKSRLLGVLSLLYKSRSVAFEIPLTALRSIHKKKHGFSHKYVISTHTGSEFVVGFTSAEQWIEAISRAAVEASEGIATRKNGDITEFLRQSND